MEEAKAMAQQQNQHHQQQQQQQQHHHQQQQQMFHQQQQFMLLQQQLQKQQQQQQQQLQSSAISRFPSNIDAHLRPLRPPSSLNVPNPNPNPSPNTNPQTHHQQSQNQNQQQQQQQQMGQNQLQQTQNQNQNQNQKAIRASNHLEVQMAYQDAWRVSHPDFKRPFSSLLDACDRLLPYHVVADYEAEEDDRILDSDTTGQMLYRSQQWDHNIAAKVAEFTSTFEKQALAFNIISRKRALGEFRSEEGMMIEQALCQEEKRAYFELKSDFEEKAGREAKMRIAAFVQAEQARAESQAHAQMMARGPIRANALEAQGSDLSSRLNMGSEQEHGVGAEEMMNGWGNNVQHDEKEPSDDFLNDEETDNGETSGQDGWRESGEFDLNSR